MISSSSFLPKESHSTDTFDDFLALPSKNALSTQPFQSSFGTMGMFSQDSNPDSRSPSLSPPSFSTLQDFDGDFQMESLHSKIVALDLNVDNHIDARSAKKKLDYSLSGAMSMTPNPRSVFKSPRKASGNLFNKYDSSALKSKLLFDEVEIEDEMKTNAAPAFNTSRLNQFQQIVLPNGTPAVVMPLYDYEQHHNRQMMRENKMKRANQNHNNVARKNKMSTTPPTSNVIPNEIPLTTFEGKIFEMSRDQNGCRYLQEKIAQDGLSAVEFLMTEVSHKLIELMMDPFGNYLFQKIIETVSLAERKNILLSVQHHLVKAAINLHGTRCVQKFVEICSKDADQVQILVNCFQQHVTKLSMDTNGNHVVQRCLQHWNDVQRQFIFKAVIRDVLQVTRHRHGCCVFQRCLDAASESWRSQLVRKIEQHAVCLVTDPFGNYVVQYVLDKSGRSDTNSVIEKFLGKFCELSMQKFSSNVIEKCVAQSCTTLRAQIMEELIHCNRIRDLLHDQYANYVVQRALLLSESSQCLRLVEQIIPQLEDLSKFNPTCSRKIAMKALKRFPHLASNSKLNCFLGNK